MPAIISILFAVTTNQSIVTLFINNRFEHEEITRRISELHRHALGVLLHNCWLYHKSQHTYSCLLPQSVLSFNAAVGLRIRNTTKTFMGSLFMYKPWELRERWTNKSSIAPVTCSWLYLPSILTKTQSNVTRLSDLDGCQRSEQGCGRGDPSSLLKIQSNNTFYQIRRHPWEWVYNTPCKAPH